MSDIKELVERCNAHAPRESFFSRLPPVILWILAYAFVRLSVSLADGIALAQRGRGIRLELIYVLDFIAWCAVLVFLIFALCDRMREKHPRQYPLPLLQ